ncbi:hypothetical protein DV735_g5330, partial [Chaetothyriales sp. CBS 134920]
MRASLELIRLFALLSLPITAVVGHPRAQIQTQTLTRFITITATATAITSSSTAGTNNVVNDDDDTVTSSGSTSTTAATSSSGFPQEGSFLNVALIPPYGIEANVSLGDGTPRCAGLDGKAIPCDCPPDPALFVSSLTQLVSSGQQQFPEGNTPSEQLTRLQSCIVTLQNIYGGPGSGVGCPAVSTTWSALLQQIQSQL